MRIAWCLWLVFNLALASILRAQDVATTPLEWINAENAPDTLPQAGRKDDPPLPPQLRDLRQPAYAEYVMLIDPSGKLADWHHSTTSPWLRTDTPLLNRFEPATRDGRKVWSEVRHYVIYNPSSARKRGDAEVPRLLEIVAPIVPESATIEGEPVVTVRAEVDSEGRVLDARLVQGDAALAQPASRAVMRWRFAPARREGVPVPAVIEVPVVFGRGLGDPEDGASEPPRVVKLVRPHYPPGLRMSGQTGEVLLSFVVSVEGRVRGAEIVRSSNPGFDEAALDAVLQWTFRPGMRNGIPVNVRMQVPVIFSLEGEPSGAAYRFTTNSKAMAALPPQFRYDHPPEVRGAVLAAYPFEALRDHKGGKVRVRLVIDEHGRVTGTRVTESPREDLGLAAQAMIECFEFAPASREGRPTPTGITFEVDFDPTGRGHVPVSPTARRLLRLLEKGGGGLAAVADLDGPIVPISQRHPQFPLGVPDDVSEGSALLEFLVDERGLVQLPRIVESSLPAFGYAAVQAVSVWRFRAPTVRGDAANVRVRLPISFRR